MVIIPKRAPYKDSTPEYVPEEHNGFGTLQWSLQGYVTMFDAATHWRLPKWT